MPAPPPGAGASAFLTLENLGSTPDTLLGVRSPEAGGVMLHTMVNGRMEMMASLPLPPGARIRLEPGSYHLMLGDLTRPLEAGDTVLLHFRFARADSIVVRAPVLRYSEAIELAAPGHP